MLARSKAGHDAGRVYLCLGSDEGYCYLADGRLKLIEHPKKKKLKHVQLIRRLPREINRLLEEENITDDLIRKVIKIYLRETDNKES